MRYKYLLFLLLFTTTAVSATQPLPTPDKQKTYDIRHYGAIGDGHTDNTRAIQKAIDIAAARGGGIISIPAGRFGTGVLELKSHITLQLAANASLLGSTNRMDYGPGHALPLL